MLTVNNERKKLHLTLKKSLVRDAADNTEAGTDEDEKSGDGGAGKDGTALITDYAHAVKGICATGFVTKTGPFGIVVTFYNNVHGLVPAKHLAKQGVEDPTESFPCGQVRASLMPCYCMSASENSSAAHLITFRFSKAAVTMAPPREARFHACATLTRRPLSATAKTHAAASHSSF